MSFSGLGTSGGNVLFICGLHRHRIQCLHLRLFIVLQELFPITLPLGTGQVLLEDLGSHLLVWGAGAWVDGVG